MVLLASDIAVCHGPTHSTARTCHNPLRTLIEVPLWPWGAFCIPLALSIQATLKPLWLWGGWGAEEVNTQGKQTTTEHAHIMRGDEFIRKQGDSEVIIPPDCFRF